MIEQDTICAIATSPGSGALAIIRLSGINAIKIVDRIFYSPREGKSIINQKANTLHFGTIKEDENIIDDVVISLFRAPHSFTGEDSVEISCHGSVYIQQQLLQLLIKKGARLAKPGEFTQRAFLNGKMDLSQAEAVADLIRSTGSASHKLAMNQMRGGFSSEIERLRDDLLKFTSLIELELDFSEEDVEFVSRSELKKLVVSIHEVFQKLITSFRLGNVIKNGVPVAIAGETNVGKSTLLNALLNEEKAIVSEIHGTTRDIVEDVVNIRGTAFRFFDTAGLRETTNVIESMGIERTYTKIDQAEIVLLMKDCTRPPDQIVKSLAKIRKKIRDQHLFVLLNKTDLLNDEQLLKITNDIHLQDNEIMLPISALKRINLDKLTDLLYEKVNLKANELPDVIVTNVRHYEALSLAQKAIERVMNGIEAGVSGDFLAQDIRECLHYMGEITGEITTDEVLGNIFKNFCIGK
jgi:tRNA modification GTPase